jgi:hypothetical protein
MTKQRKPHLNWNEFHVIGEMDDGSLYMAHLEHVFAIFGSACIAEELAMRLRNPSPWRVALDQIARMLDPSDDGYLKLRVVRHRKGRTAMKYVNDAAIVKAVKKGVEARRNKHGRQKMAVAEVAKQFRVSKATVLKALRSK